MKSCKREQMAYLYNTGTLSQKESEIFKAHLSGCETCRAIVSDVANIRGFASEALSEQPLAGINQRIMNGIKIRESEKKTTDAGSRWRFIYSWERILAPASLAACAALMFCVVTTTPEYNAPSSGAGIQSSAAPEKPSDYFVQYGGDAELSEYLGEDGDAALTSYFDNFLK